MPLICGCRDAAQTSLGNLNEEANEGYSKVFFEYFKEKLGAPDNRGYMCVSCQFTIATLIALWRHSYMGVGCRTFFDPGNENIG